MCPFLKDSLAVILSLVKTFDFIGRLSDVRNVSCQYFNKILDLNFELVFMLILKGD